MLLKKPTPHQATKLSETYNFNFLHSNNNKMTTPSKMTQPQYSFMNILKPSDKNNKKINELFIHEGGFKKVGESVISASNSMYNTPLM
jgi:hypothetical protein